MARDPNPLSPGETGAWIKQREDGKYIDVSLQGPPTSDPKLAWMQLDFLSSRKPTASELIAAFAINTGDDYHLYLDQSSKNPVGDDGIVDLDKYGLKMNNAIVIEEKKKSDDKSDKADDDGNKDGNNDDQDSNNGDKNSNNGDEDSNNGDKDSNNGDKDSNNGDKDSNNGDKDSNNGDKDSNNGDKDSNNGDKDSNNGDKDSNNGDKDSNNGDKDSNNGDKDSNDGKNDDNSKDNSTGREYHPRFPHTKGYWFVVTNRHGNNIDVSAGATAVDKDDSTLGWNPIPKDSSLPTNFVASGRIKGKICRDLDLDPQDYKVYSSQSDDDANFYTNTYVIDFRSVGLRGNDPMMVKYNTTRDDSSDGGGEDGEDGNGGNDQEDSGNVNTDPYVNFTRRLQNITIGDWSIYPEAIPNTVVGEILWTDGNASYSFASAPTIQAYKVVRRSPSVYNGTVIQTGLASASPYYFRLLD